jgi:predicted DNA-binding protein
MATKPKQIRIDDEPWLRLKAQSERIGVTAAQFVREAIYEKLDGASNRDLLEEIERNRLRIESLTDDLAEATRAVLVIAGSQKPYPAEKADAWVDSNLGLKNSRRG